MAAVLTTYTDRVFLNLTDRCKIGTIVSHAFTKGCRFLPLFHAVTSQMMGTRKEHTDGTATYKVHTVLGKRDVDWHDLVARQLTEVVMSVFAGRCVSTQGPT